MSRMFVIIAGVIIIFYLDDYDALAFGQSRKQSYLESSGIYNLGGYKLFNSFTRSYTESLIFRKVSQLEEKDGSLAVG